MSISPSSNDPLTILMQKKIFDYQDQIYKKDGYSNLVKKLEEILCKEAELLLRGCGQIIPPFDPLKIKLGKIRFKLKMNSSRDAHIPTKEGFIIEIRDLDNLSVRARTTLAHEIGHTFFYDITELPPKPLGVVSSKKVRWTLETICYKIGRTLLMPQFSIFRILARNPNLKNPSFTKIGVLRNTYRVSSDIVAWRMIKDLKMWKSCFLKSEARRENEEITFRLIPFPLKNDGVRDFDLLKMKRVIDREHELYPHLLRASSSKEKVTDIIGMEKATFLLESKRGRLNVITTLVSLRDYQPSSTLTKYA